MSRKHTTQLLFAAEAAAPRDVVESVVGLLEGPACRLDANAFDSAGRCALACIGVAAGAILGTHSDLLRQMPPPQTRPQGLLHPAFPVCVFFAGFLAFCL